MLLALLTLGFALLHYFSFFFGCSMEVEDILILWNALKEAESSLWPRSKDHSLLRFSQLPSRRKSRFPAVRRLCRHTRRLAAAPN